MNHFPRQFKPATVLAAALFLAGCASFSGPYETPAVKMPAAYAHAGTSTALPGDSAWWTSFADPELDRLVAQALARNNNLAASTLRVRRAQLQAGLASNQLGPQFSGSASAGSSRLLEAGGGSTRSSSVTLAARYELDLWNRLGSQQDMARWEALATEEDRQSTALALVGTTARLYWQIGFLNQRLATNAQSIAYAQKTFDLVQTQYRAGAVSGLEVAEAQQTLASQLASQSQLQQQAVEAANALALIFNGPPGTVVTQPASLPTAELQPISAGLPADLLGRRPDLRAAEWRVRQSFTNIDATRASYYPSLSLTGSLGSSSAALVNVLQNPVASLALGIGLPFLQQTAMKLNVQISQAQYDEAVVNFRQTLYTALADVDNALSAHTQLAQQAGLLSQALASARNAERLYEIRYRAGAVPLKSWLDAQEKRRAAETAVAENRLARLSNQMAVNEALGGSARP